MSPKETFSKITGKKPKKKVLIALQGGGAYGGFAWGVLDRLLEEDDIEISGVSGVSAGAINAAALAHGLDEGGPQKAKEILEKTWDSIAYDDIWQDIPGGETAAKIGRGIKKLDFTGTIEKYEVNVRSSVLLAMNLSVPKRFVERIRNMRIQQRLDGVIDFKKMRKKKDGVPLFVGVTDLMDHQNVIFKRDKMSADVIAASCAIPGIFPEVQIDGVPYWDGGMSENPSTRPLKDCEGQDILFIQTVPADQKPKRRRLKKGKEEDFPLGRKLFQHFMNASIRREIAQIDDDNEKVRKHPMAAKLLGLKEYHVHSISNENIPDINGLNFLNFDRQNLGELRKQGYEAADKWLKQNAQHLGKKSTFDGIRPSKWASSNRKAASEDAAPPPQKSKKPQPGHKKDAP